MELKRGLKQNDTGDEHDSQTEMRNTERLWHPSNARRYIHIGLHCISGQPRLYKDISSIFLME